MDAGSWLCRPDNGMVWRRILIASKTSWDDNRHTDSERWEGSTGAKKWGLIAAGSVCVILGTIGVVMPLVPTTPFLLLAAACYLRSSRRLYQWLINHRVLGRYVGAYLSGEGIPVSAKVFTISLLWFSIATSAIFVVEMTLIRVLLLIIAIGVTVHVMSIRPLRDDPGRTGE